MGTTARAFWALGDPARQRMLRVLEEAGELCVSDVVGHFEMTQPAVSHHLKILREAGLLTARKRGKEVYYSINSNELSTLCRGFFAKFACCRSLLKSGRR